MQIDKIFIYTEKTLKLQIFVYNALFFIVENGQ